MGKESRKKARNLQKEMNIPKEEERHFLLKRMTPRGVLKCIISIILPMFSLIIGRMIIYGKVYDMHLHVLFVD